MSTATKNITAPQEITSVVAETGLEKSTADILVGNFSELFTKAKEWKAKAEALVVTDESQKAEMKMAREARLALKEIRVEADKRRKALKEDSLRYGKAVQGVYNVIEYLIVPIETHLKQQEDFILIQEEKRIAKLRDGRNAEAEPLREFVPFGIDLGLMSEEDYAKLITGARMQLEARREAAEKAERERIDRERIAAIRRDRELRIAPLQLFIKAVIDRESLGTISEEAFNTLVEDALAEKQRQAELQERTRIENERLRAEKEAAEKAAAEERARAEAAARKEREAAEAKLRAEREEKERLERQIREREAAEKAAKAEAEKKAKAEEAARIAAEKKAAAAPDKQKIAAYIASIRAVVLPQLATPEAVDAFADAQKSIIESLNRLAQRAEIL